MKPISVKDAKYLDAYKIKILFNDNEKRIVDFETFLKSQRHPEVNNYKESANF